MTLGDTEAMLQMAQLMEAAGVMVAVYDQDDRLRFTNRAFRDAWFIAEDEQPLWSELMRRNFNARRGTIVAAADFEAGCCRRLPVEAKADFAPLRPIFMTADGCG